MKQDSSLPNGDQFKLTKSGLPREILRSSPVFVIVYLCLRLLTIIGAKLLPKAPSPSRSPLTVVTYGLLVQLANLVFEMNFVDFLFYSTYNLMSFLHFSNLKNLSFTLNKAISLLILVECSVYISKLMGAAVDTQQAQESLVTHQLPRAHRHPRCQERPATKSLGEGVQR
jgi:hypothetical protein